MKKLLVLLMSIIILTGCSNNKTDNQKDIYVKYIKELNNVKKSSNNIPFDIEVKYDKLIENEVRYQVIIDNVKENIYDIKALAIHNKETNDVFPSIGIFDEKQDLLKDQKPSGVILVGYIDYQGKIEKFSCTIKLIIKYKDSNKKSHTVYYVTKK